MNCVYFQPKMTKAIQRSAIKNERRCITLGTHKGEGVSWIEIINTDRRWYLVSQYLYPGYTIEEGIYYNRYQTHEKVSRLLKRWIIDEFLREFENSIKWYCDETGHKLLRLHAISFLEADHIFTQKERIAFPKGSSFPAPWYLDTTHTNDREHCMFVNTKGEIITEDKPRFGETAYVRLGLELLTEKNPYWDKDMVLRISNGKGEPYFYNWPLDRYL